MSLKHDTDKVIAFERAGLLFVFNFHATNSFTDYRLGVDAAGTYQVTLSTDDAEFGGHSRVDKSCKHYTDPLGFAGRRNFVQVSASHFPLKTQLSIECFPFADLSSIEMCLDLFQS